MLKNLFLLNNLTPNEQDVVIDMLPDTVAFKKDDVIYSADNFKNALGYIVNGSAHAVTENNDGMFMKSFSVGSVFGAAALFGNNQCYISKILADSDCEILFIDEEKLTYIFKKFPQTSINYISFLSDKIRFLNRKLNLISCTSAEDTVYKYLLDNMDGENIVNLPVSFTRLADMLSLGRASLYRSLDTLEKKGKIKREKNIIKVI